MQATSVSAAVVVPEELVRPLQRALDHPRSIDWVLWAWRALADADRVPADMGDRAPTEHVITFGALGLMIETFTNLVTGLNAPDEFVPELLGDEDPLITDLELGRHCEREGIADAELPESPHRLLQLAIAQREPAVRQMLRQVLDESSLFASMAQVVNASGQDRSDRDVDDDRAVGVPWVPDLSDAAVRSEVNGDATWDRQHAYHWLIDE